MEFYTILTNVGRNKLAAATANGSTVRLTQMRLGDGNGASYDPTASQTSLRREVWRGNVTLTKVDPQNPNWIVVEVDVPATDGGFMIREAGIFDSDGAMIAVSKYPETYKPVVSEGSAKELKVRTIIEVSNASSVTLNINPNVITVTESQLNAAIGNVSTQHMNFLRATNDLALGVGWVINSSTAHEWSTTDIPDELFRSGLTSISWETPRESIPSTSTGLYQVFRGTNWNSDNGRDIPANTTFNLGVWLKASRPTRFRISVAGVMGPWWDITTDWALYTTTITTPDEPARRSITMYGEDRSGEDEEVIRFYACAPTLTKSDRYMGYAPPIDDLVAMSNRSYSKAEIDRMFLNMQANFSDMLKLQN